ncbi:MAG TPA: GntR family transcriptional regulator [Chthonomonadaceae bacterium]|nr:GntR family transcriptional regulator [Chthonomonadaceae bacterium]
METRIDHPSSPTVSKIVATLAERIQSGRYQEGKWFPTERELEEEFAVSRTLIRQAVEVLEQRRLVLRSPRCRTIVQNPNRAHPLPPETARRTLGLWIWPDPTHPVGAMVVRGIYKALDHRAYRLVAGHPVGEDWAAIHQSEAHFLEGIAQDRDVVGVLLWYMGGPVNLPALQTVRAAGIPMIFLDRRPPEGFPADYVGVDNVHAAEQVVTHLIDQGHRRIAHITNWDEVSTVAERLTGYRRALQAANIPFQPELVMTEVQPSPDHPDDADAELAERLLSVPDPPTAVFVVNDILALRLVSALRTRGVNVPEGMAVAGFDGIERWLPGDRFLTTADQPFERIGSRSVDLLLHQIEAKENQPYKHIELDAPLSIHASTRPSSRLE